MKRIALFIYLSIISVLISEAQEQELSKKDVPKVVMESFKANIPKYKSPEWASIDTNYQVTFFNDSKWIKAYFSPIGLWLKTKTQIEYEKLPDMIKKKFESSKYNDLELGQVYKIKNPDGLELYEIQVINIEGVIKAIEYNIKEETSKNETEKEIEE